MMDSNSQNDTESDDLSSEIDQSNNNIDISDHTPFVLKDPHKIFIAKTIKEFATKSHGRITDKTLQVEVVKEFNAKFKQEITLDIVRKEIDNIRKTHNNIRKRSIKESEANYQLSKLKENLIKEANTKRYRHEKKGLLQAADRITMVDPSGLTKLQQARHEAFTAIKNNKVKETQNALKESERITNYYQISNKSASGLHVKVKKIDNLSNNNNSNSNSNENANSNSNDNKENKDPNHQLTRKEIMFKTCGNANKRQKELDEQNKIRTEFYQTWTRVGEALLQSIQLNIQQRDSLEGQPSIFSNTNKTTSDTSEHTVIIQGQMTDESV